MGRGVSGATRAIVTRAAELWKCVYHPADIVPTVRQIFYALAVEGFVPKSEKGYDQVQRTLARARERGEYPWNGIYDGLRQVREPNTWDDLPDFLGDVRKAYRLDKWAWQPRRVEVWIEKDAVRGTVESVAGDYEVPLLCGRGYLSVTAKKEASLRIAGRTILYVGDFDPSGVNMLEETEAWIRTQGGDAAPEAAPVFERIAVNEADYADQGLIHLPVNPKDARAADFLHRFGDTVVEVEALPPETLRRRLCAAIERHRDERTWQHAAQRENADKEVLARICDEAAP